MATAEQIKALVRSFSDGDEEIFFSVALQIAAKEARQGHKKLAAEIKELVDKAKESRDIIKKPSMSPVSIIQPRGELAGLLSASYSKTRLADVFLPENLRSKLKRVVTEQRQRNLLREHSLKPRNKILLVGPPGTGKTMTAKALSGEMSLPLFDIQLDGLITKYMGETSAKMRLIFDAISRTKGIYFFDEFDAIGGKRTLQNDVGEIRRVLNSFLQFIEEDVSDNLIIAATNHPEILDKALFRRFDDVLEYSLPSKGLILKVFKNQLHLINTKNVEWEKVIIEAKGLSFSEIVKACEDTMKENLLKNNSSSISQVLIASLKERKSFYKH